MTLPLTADDNRERRDYSERIKPQPGAPNHGSVAGVDEAQGDSGERNRTGTNAERGGSQEKQGKK